MLPRKGASVQEHRSQAGRGSHRARECPCGRLDQRPEVAEQVLEVRRELADAPQRRADVVGDRQQLLDERPGVRLEVVQGAARVARVSRWKVGRIGNDSASARRSPQARRRSARSRRSRRPAPGRARTAPRRPCRCRGRGPSRPPSDGSARARISRGVRDERAEVAERVVQVLPAAGDRERAVLLPALEGVSGLGVERVEDLVDLGRVPGLRDAERAALLDRLDAPRPRRRSRWTPRRARRARSRPRARCPM